MVSESEFIITRRREDSSSEYYEKLIYVASWVCSWKQLLFMAVSNSQITTGVEIRT